MPDNKQYYVQIPAEGDGQVQEKVVDEQSYENHKDELFNTYRNADVRELTRINPGEEFDYRSDDEFEVSLDDLGEKKIIGADQFISGIDKLYESYPNASVTRWRKVNYWGGRLEDLNKQIGQLEYNLGKTRDAFNQADWDITDEDLDSKAALAAARSSMASKDEMEVISKRLDKLYREREDNPEWQAGKVRQIERLNSSVADIDKRQKQLEKRNKKAWDAYWAEHAGSVGGMVTPFKFLQLKKEDQDVGVNRDIESYAAARLMYKDALETAKAPSRYDKTNGVGNFFRGLTGAADEVFTPANLIRAGLNMHLVDAIKRIQDAEGKNANIVQLIQQPEYLGYLSDGEKELVKAFVVKSAIDAQRAGDLSLGYQSGQTAMQSLGFMADFLMFGGIGEDVAKASTKWMTKGIAKTSMNMGLQGAKRELAMAVPKFLEGTLQSAVKTLVMSPLMPSSYANFTNSLLQINNRGGVDLSGEAILKTFFNDVFIENLSENAGEQVENILGFALKPVGAGAKAIGRKALGDVTFDKWIKIYKNAPVTKLLKQAGFNGYIGEIGEEWYGNALRVFSGTDKDALKDFSTMENQIVTLTSFAPMSLIGLGGSLAQYRMSEKRLGQTAADLKAVLEKNGYTSDKIDNILAVAKAESPTLFSPKNIAKHLAPVINQVAKDNLDAAPEVFKAVCDYAKAVADWRVFDGVNESDVNDKRDAMFQEINNGVGATNWYRSVESAANVEGSTEEDEPHKINFDYVRFIDDADGHRWFVQAETDGEIAMIDRNGQKSMMSRAKFEEGIASGELSDSGEMHMPQFLDMELTARDRAAEEQRMGAESQRNAQTLYNTAQLGTEVNLGTVESPNPGIIREIQPDRFIVEAADGVREVSPEQMAGYLGLPYRPKTDAEIENQQVSAEQRRADLRSRAQALAGTDIASILGIDGKATLVRVHNTPENEQQGLFQMDYERGGEYNIAMVTEDQLAQIVAMGNQASAAVVKEEEAQEQQQRSDTPVDFRGNPLPMRTNSITGEQVVDGELLWKTDPEAWAYWNDTNPKQRTTSVERLDFTIKKVEGQIEKQEKDIHKASLEGVSDEQMDKMEYDLSQLQQRAESLQGILNNYRRAERREARELAEPQTLDELAANGLVGMQHSLDREDFKRETGWSDTELNKFFPWWAKKGQGLTLKEVAERIAHDEGQTGLVPQDANVDQPDVQAVRDAIIDILRSASVPSDITNYTRNANLARREQMEREAKAAEEAARLQAETEAAAAAQQQPAWPDGDMPDFENMETPLQAEISAAREQVDTNPTEAQKEAGNYAKGHLVIDGYNITLENPKGSTRSGVDASGKEWSQVMNNDYGYIRMTEGVDGDHIDVFLSDNPEQGDVFVVDQIDPQTGEFDEHKVMYGFGSAEQAREAYLANYEPGWKGLGTITEVSKEEFKKWIESSHRKTKPFADYKSVKPVEQAAPEHGTINFEQPAEEAAVQKPATLEEARAALDAALTVEKGHYAYNDGTRLILEGMRANDAIREMDRTARTLMAEELAKDTRDRIIGPLQNYIDKLAEDYGKRLEQFGSPEGVIKYANDKFAELKQKVDTDQILPEEFEAQVKDAVDAVGMLLRKMRYDMPSTVEGRNYDWEHLDESGYRGAVAELLRKASPDVLEQINEQKDLPWTVQGLIRNAVERERLLADSREYRQMYFDAHPEMPSAEPTGKFDIWKFVGKDKQRPAMTGIFHDKGFKVASDTHSLVAIREAYPKENEGKIIDKKKNVIRGANYPKWRDLIQKGEDAGIDIKHLASFVEGVKALKGKNFSSAKIVVPLGGEMRLFNAEPLANFLRAAQQIEGKLSFRPLGESGKSLILQADGKNGHALIMNVMPSNWTSPMIHWYATPAELEQLARQREQDRVVEEASEPQAGVDLDAALADGGRTAILKRIDKWKKLLGNIFIVHDDISTIDDPTVLERIREYDERVAAGESRDAAAVRGWFDPATGTAHIYLPHLLEMSNRRRNLDETILHEVISHKGLRALFGNKYNAFLDVVWRDLMGSESRERELGYVNGSAQNVRDRRAAADEFLAHAAEGESAIVKQLDATWWQRLANAVKEFMNTTLGVDVFKDVSTEGFARLLQDAMKVLKENGNSSDQVDSSKRFSFTDVRFPASVTKEQRETISKTLKDYTDQTQHQKVKEVCVDIDKRIEVENEEINGPILREIGDVRVRLKELNAQKGRIFQRNEGKENIPIINAEIQQLKTREKELRDSIKKVNLSAFDIKRRKDQAIIEAGILDNDTWRGVGVVPTFELEVEKELKRMGWNGEDNMMYATEYGFVSHWEGHHPDMTESEVSYDMLRNLYEPTVVGFEARYPDTMLFIRNDENGLWYITAVKANHIKNDGSLLLATTYKDKENPSKKLARTLSLGRQKGTVASNQIHRSFNDHGAKVSKNSELASKYSKKEAQTLKTQDVLGSPKVEEMTEFSPETHEGTALFSVKDDKGKKTLVGIHNISAEKLAAAIRMGGLANPSAAVIDLSHQDHFAYADISLIMPSSLVDAKTGRNIGTFDRDAWTPMYPTVDYFSTKESDKKLKALTADLPEALGRQIRYTFGMYMDKNTYNSGLEYLFLKEKGEETGIQTTPRRYPNLTLAQLWEMLGVPADTKQYDSEVWLPAYEALPEDKRVDFNIVVKTGGDPQKIARDREILADKNAKHRKMFRKIFAEPMGFGPLDNFFYSLMKDERDAGQEDMNLTIAKAIDTVREKGYGQEFGEWQTKIIDDLGYEEKIFVGHSPSGNPKYVPNTLENVSKYMKRLGRNASDDHGKTGAGILKSKLAKKYMSLAQIRSHRDQLVNYNNEKVNAINDGIRDIVCTTFYSRRLAEEFGLYTAELVSQEYAEDILVKGMDIDKVVERFNREEKEDLSLSEEEKAEIRQLRQDIINLPAFYFETKFERPVYFNEFAAAVVPSDIPASARKALEDYGLPIYEYKEGDNAARSKAVREASEADGIRFSFIGERGARIADNAREDSEKIANLSVAREMETAGKPARLIKQATGWERGADKKWRYELPDDWTFDTSGNVAYRKRNPDFARWEELIRKRNMHAFYPEDHADLTAEEEAQFDKLDLIYSHPASAYKDWRNPHHNSSRVKDYIDAPELFEAYPGLANVEVRWEEMEPFHYGSMNYGDNVIKLNKSLRMTAGPAKSALAHEMQHWIQEVEGFAGGTSLEAAERTAQRMSYDPLTPYQRKFMNDVQSFLDMKAYFDAKGVVPTDNNLAVWMKGSAGDYDPDFAGDYILNATAEEMMKEYERLREKDKSRRVVRAIDVYLNTAGEVEARNMQSRLVFNEFQRMNTLAEDTEDVARKDQIVRFTDWGFSRGGLVTPEFVAAQAAQKVPGRDYSEGEADGVRFSLSNNNRKTVTSWLGKRKDLTDEQRKAVIDYLDAMDNPKLQLATAKWFSQGTIRLPEDMYKVEQAVSVSTKAKVDPLQYASPMELLDDHADIRPTEKRIDPNTVSTLHKAKEYPDYGIVVYDVDEGEQSRKNMREIINTHFGREASPWCLLRGDGNGNLTRESKEYWHGYNAYPKQVAFRNGKLYAFSANDEKTRLWWDRQDNPYTGFPMDMEIPDDALGRSATYTLNPDTGELSSPKGKHRGNKKNGLYEEWNDWDVLIARFNYRDGHRFGLQETFYSGGEPCVRETFGERGENLGDYTVWYANGQLKNEWHFNEDGRDDGLQRSYHANGQLHEERPMVDGKKEGIVQMWNDKGQLVVRQEYADDRRNGLEQTWSDNGTPETEINYKDGLRDGPSRVYRAGRLIREATYKKDMVVGEQKTWYESGNIKSIRHFDDEGFLHGEQVEYYDFVGREEVFYRKNYNHGELDGPSEEWWDKDKPKLRETWSNGKHVGLFEEWYPNGVLKWRRNYNDKGQLDGVSEQYTAGGTLFERYTYKDGEIVEYRTGREVALEAENEGGVSFSIVSDKDEIERLEKIPTTTLYRAMELIDGALYPPMIQKMPNVKGTKGGKLQRRQGAQLGQWEKADEDPSKAYQKKSGGPWYYDLKKIKGSDVNGVLYNPYLHLSASPLNDQFSAASQRPNLVTVACEVPITELSGRYKAEKANDPIGAKDWHSGSVTAQLGEGRQVVLSRWAKPVRIVPDSEVASLVAPKLVAKGIIVPDNVVTPSLKAALERKGVKFSAPEEDEDGVKFSVTEGNISDFGEFHIVDLEQKRKKLQSTKPIPVSVGVIKAHDGLRPIEAANEWYDSNIGEPQVYSTEVGEVVIDKESVQESLSHKFGQAKLDAVSSLFDGFKGATYIASMNDLDGKPLVDHYFAYPIQYDNALSYVMCRAREDVNLNRLYIHEVFPLEKISSETLQTLAGQSQPQRGLALYKKMLGAVLYGKGSNNSENSNSSDTRFSMANNNQAIFVSNAQKAVEDIELPNLDNRENVPAHAVRMTDEMRESVMADQSMFSVRDKANAGYVDQKPFQDRLDKGEDKETVLNEYMAQIQSEDYSVVIAAKKNFERTLVENGITKKQAADLALVAKYQKGEAVNVGSKGFFVLEAIKGIEHSRTLYVHERQHKDTLTMPDVERDVVKAYGWDGEGSMRPELFDNASLVETAVPAIKASLEKLTPNASRYYSKPFEDIAREIISYAQEVAYREENFVDKLKNDYLVPDKVVDIVKEFYERRNNIQHEGLRGRPAGRVDSSGTDKSRFGRTGEGEEGAPGDDRVASGPDAREREGGARTKDAVDAIGYDKAEESSARRGTGSESRGRAVQDPDSTEEPGRVGAGLPGEAGNGRDASVQGDVGGNDGETQGDRFSKENAVTNTAAVLGVEVEFLPASEMTVNGRRLAGRWQDGKISICLQNCRDARDAARTVIHEAVGHEGLRKLVGAQNMREFCLSLYHKLPREASDAIANAAITKYGGNFVEATEEWLAERAEDMDFGKGSGVWDTIRAAVRDLLRKVGVDLTFSERDVRWLLWQSYYANKDNEMMTEVRRRVLAGRLGFSIREQEDRAGAETVTRRREAEQISAARIYNMAVQAASARLHEVFVDKDDSLNRLVDAIEQSSGRKAKDFEDVRLALNQQSSKGLAATEKFIREKYEPMMEAIKAIVKAGDLSVEDVERYVKIKHGIERNEVFAKRDARNYYKAIADKEISRIKDSEAEEDLKDSLIEREKSKLDRHLEKVDKGADPKYREFREKDYGGLTAMYSNFEDVKPYDEGVESYEEYQARVLASRKPAYDTLAETEAAAEREVRSFEESVGSALTDELWKRINAATKSTLLQQYKSNMMSRRQYETVRDMFKFYVPLRGFKDNTAADMYNYYMSDNSGEFTPPLLKAGGRKTESESPFGYIGSMASSAITEGVKNESKLALYYFITNRPDNDLMSSSEVWYENTGITEDGRRIFSPAYPPITQDLSAGAARKAFIEWEEAMKAKARSGYAYKGTKNIDLNNSVINIDDREKNEHIIRFKINGEERMMFINGNPRAAQAMNNLLNVHAAPSELVAALQKILRYVAAVNTQLNPEFWMTNLQRDLLFATMSQSAKENKEFNRLFHRNLVAARRVLKLKKAYEKGTLGTSQEEQYYREFVENGGVTGYSRVIGTEEWENEVRKFNKKEKKAVKAFLDVLHVIGDFGEAIEQMTRFAAYRTSRETGKGVIDSVADAKELTVNFNRKGSGIALTFKEAEKLRDSKGRPLSKVQQVMVVAASSLGAYARSMIVFLNAAVQGLNNMVKLYKKNRRAMLVWTAGYFVLGALNAVMHALLDDDDNDDYLDMPANERRNNLVLGYDGVYFKWALPQESRVFYGAGDILVNHALGRTPDKTIAGELLSAVGEVSPIDISSGVSALAPSITTPIVEIIRNEDWTGGRVYNERRFLSKEEREHRPKYRDPLKNTPDMYVWMSEALNAISGGNAYEGGALNWDPNIIEHLVEGYTGGLGTSLEKFFVLVGNTAQGRFVVRDTPFLRRLLSINDERYRNAHVTELYYYYKGEAENTRRIYKEAMKAGDEKRLQKLTDSKDFRIMQIYESFKSEMKTLDDDLKALGKDQDEEKKEIMRRQDALRKEMIRQISELK